MISYRLRCENDHSFDSWFQNSSAFERQAKRGLITCPICDSSKVEKAIMAPRIARQRARTVVAEPQTTNPSQGNGSASMALMSPAELELRKKIKEVRDHIARHADHVGEKFPEEARKIHYGESDPRPIFGEASLQEAKELIDEGIDVTPLPSLPDDRN